MSTTHDGACHCGAVRFKVTFPDDPAANLCNCSICAMKAMVSINVPLAALQVTAGQDKLATYGFNTGVAEHRFCTVCGIHVFQKLRSEPDKFGINGACVPGFGRFDFAELPVHDSANAHPRDTGGSTVIAGTVRFYRAR